MDQAGGGVLIYASDLYIFSQLKQLHVDTFESLWVEFKYKSCRPIIVSCIYRPPKSDVVWFDHFEYILHEVYKLKNNIIMTGDLNINLLSESRCSWKELYSCFNLTQLIDVPTRVCGNSVTLLDHVYVTDVDSAACSFISGIALSDHFPVGVVWNGLTGKDSSSGHKIVTIRKYVDLNSSNVRTVFSNNVNTVMSKSRTVNDMVNGITCILNCVNSDFISRKRRVKYQTRPKWFSEEICKAMVLRDKYKPSKQIALYKYWRNEVGYLIRKHKNRYYKNKIVECKGNFTNLENY